MEQTKKCFGCHEVKPLDTFGIDNHKKSGRKSRCLTCCSEKLRLWRKDNHEKAKARDRAWASKNRDKIKEKNKKRYNSINEHQRLRLLLKTASNTNKEFNLTQDHLVDLWGKQQGLCAYSKLPLTAKAHQFNTISLDRIDSKKGYLIGNVHLVCTAINRMKLNYSEELFLLLCHGVAQNNELSDPPDNLLARCSEEGALHFTAPNNIGL
jgi:hypothetical protein